MVGPAVIVMVGECSGRNWETNMRPLGWGRMYTIRKPMPGKGEPWGWDNGAFVAWLSGTHASLWDMLARLKRDRVAGTPYLAVTPDVVAGGEASLDLSVRARAALPDDWPWYLAVQNDMKPMQVARYIRRFSGIFLGGDNAFKAEALTWCQLAHDHGLPFHYGRAGTMAKVEHAFEVGADSLDSSFPLWTKERLAGFIEQWQERPQITLSLAKDASA